MAAFRVADTVRKLAAVAGALLAVAAVSSWNVQGLTSLSNVLPAFASVVFAAAWYASAWLVKQFTHADHSHKEKG